MMRTLKTILILSAVIAVCVSSLFQYYRQNEDEPIYPSPSLSGEKRLSDFLPSLFGTRGDTPIFIFDSKIPGASLLVLGGTHADEPAGMLSAYVMLENIHVTAGKVYVIPHTNHSAITHTGPGEAHPTLFHIDTPEGLRAFRFGNRFTNPLDQWPDPEVYLHRPSLQELAGAETRNLNRNFPGRIDGTFTEKIAFAITELIKIEDISIVIDLHEASPEYPVINALVAHDRAMDVAAVATMNLQAEGVDIALEPSPEQFRGLSHRELGDATPVLSLLMETGNVSQGRLRGRVTDETILSGVDNMYVRAAKVNMVKIPYDETGISIETRVGRHLSGIHAIVDAHNTLHPESPLSYDGVPGFNELQTKKIGTYLRPKMKKDKS